MLCIVSEYLAFLHHITAPVSEPCCLVLVLQENARPLDDIVIGNARLVTWMHLLRLAVALGQCDRQRWQSLQQQLVSESRFHRVEIDVPALYDTEECIHALLPPLTAGLSHRAISHGIISRSVERKGELTLLMERGHSRLALINILLQATNDCKINRLKSKEFLKELTGMLIGECKLRPQFAVVLMSAMGNGVLDRARTLADIKVTPGLDGIPQCLSEDISNLKLLPSGVLDLVGYKTAITIAKVAAVLDIRNAMDTGGGDVSAEVAEQGQALQYQLLGEVHSYITADTTKATGLLNAQDFIAHELLGQAKKIPGITQLHVIMSLLSVVTTGCVRSLCIHSECIVF